MKSNDRIQMQRHKAGGGLNDSQASAGTLQVDMIVEYEDIG
jgi:hypothetical protein